MAHEVHTTEAIIIDCADIAEADKLFWLLTRDFGLILATARSVREEVSKLRYALQAFSVADISLVRGRTSWRITGATLMPHVHALTKDARVVFGRIASLVRRVVPNEEVEGDIYDYVLSAYCELQDADARRGYRIEVATVLRILYALGYVPQNDAYASMLSGAYDTGSEEVHTTNALHVATSAINTALAESQL